MRPALVLRLILLLYLMLLSHLPSLHPFLYIYNIIPPPSKRSYSYYMHISIFLSLIFFFCAPLHGTMKQHRRYTRRVVAQPTKILQLIPCKSRSIQIISSILSDCLEGETEKFLMAVLDIRQPGIQMQPQSLGSS